jgi:hypothetical protein
MSHPSTLELVRALALPGVRSALPPRERVSADHLTCKDRGNHERGNDDGDGHSERQFPADGAIVGNAFRSPDVPAFRETVEFIVDGGCRYDGRPNWRYVDCQGTLTQKGFGEGWAGLAEGSEKQVP